MAYQVEILGMPIFFTSLCYYDIIGTSNKFKRGGLYDTNKK